jgi:hypothetical protein
MAPRARALNPVDKLPEALRAVDNSQSHANLSPDTAGAGELLDAL